MTKKILTLDNIPVIKKNIGRIDTIEKLKASTIHSLGDVVEVLGFHTKGDGSHHKRIAKSEDDGSGELGQNGIWWCIVHSGEVNVSWFGAKSDFDFESYTGTGSSDHFEKAINYCARSYSTELVVDGRFYLERTITTKNPLILKGRSVPCRHMVENSDNDIIKFNKPASSIAVAPDIVAFELLGYGISNSRDTRIFLEKIKFFGKRKGGGFYGSSTLIHTKVFGSPARPIAIRDCEFQNLYRVIVIESTSDDTGGTNFYSSDFSSLNAFYCDGFIETINPRKLQGFGGFSIKDSVIEQGCRINIQDIMGYGEINNCLLEGSDSVLKLKLHSNASMVVRGIYFEKNTGISVIDSEVGGQRNSLDFSYCYDLDSSHSFNIRSLKVKMLGNEVSKVCTFSSVEFIEKDFILNNTQIDTAVYYKNGSKLQKKPANYYSSFKFSTYSDVIDGIKVREISAGSNNYANRNITGVKKDSYIVAQFYNAGQKFNCSARLVDLNGAGDYTEVSTLTIPAKSFVTLRLKLLKDVSGTPVGLYLGGVTTKTYLSGGYYNVDESPLHNDFLCAVNVDSESTLSILDTPYYTLKMQEQGIYEEYVAYRDELHEYENSQTTDETMLLPALHEPEIPESVKQFAKKYKLT